MSLTCQGLTVDCLDTSRFKIGRSGYTGAPIPQAIVLHRLQAESVAMYRNSLCSPLPKFLCPSPFDPCAFPATVNPKGVHFTVTKTAITQLAELSSTTFGIDFINGTWPGILALLPITDPNGPFIHIAIDTNCGDLLTSLLCCIGVSLNRSLPIITAGDLQTDRESFPVDPSLQTQVDTCVANGGFLNPPNIFDLEERVNALEQCCLEARSDILTLKEDVELLNGRLTLVEQKQTAQQNQINYILDQITILPTLLEQITNLTNIVDGILTRCCPAPVAAECFHYQLLPGDEMLVTPNQCIWLNLPTKIEDRDNPNCVTGCCGPIVKPGPLWRADLSVSDCNSCSTWQIDASVRFRLAPACAGKKYEMYLVACGKKYLMDSFTVTSTVAQAITLTGNFLLPAGCADVHLLICTSDDTAKSAAIVEYGFIKGCCV